MLQQNLGLRKEDGLMSQLMLSSWKNGVFVDKENKYRNLALLVISSELVLSLAGTFAFSYQPSNTHFYTTVVSSIFAVLGLQSSFSSSNSLGLNLVNSNLTAILISTLLILTLAFNFTSAIFSSIIALPFLIDAFVGLSFALHNAKRQSFQQLREELLVDGTSVTQNKESDSILPKEVQSLLNYISQTEFFKNFCHQSWKKDAFNMENAFELQMTSGILIFVQLYISIMCAVESDMAPIFSIFVSLYSLASLYAYFGVSTHLDAFQSYFASSKLTFVAYCYAIEFVIRTGSISFGFSFFLMTLLLSYDTYQGLSIYFSQESFAQSTEAKQYQQLSDDGDAKFLNNKVSPSFAKDFVFRHDDNLRI